MGRVLIYKLLVFGRYLNGEEAVLKTVARKGWIGFESPTFRLIIKYAAVAELARRTGLKILYTRNDAG